MSNDLIAGVVAITLGAAVVIVGLLRNLSETTRSGIRQAGSDPEQSTATLGLYEGEDRPRRSPSPRERRWMIWSYLLISLGFGAFAVLSAHGGLFDAILAASFALNAVVVFLRKPGQPQGTPPPDSIQRAG